MDKLLVFDHFQVENIIRLIPTYSEEFREIGKYIRRFITMEREFHVLDCWYERERDEFHLKILETKKEEIYQ